MRKILFRGKRVDNGEWVEGSLYYDPDLEQSQIYGFNYTYNSETGEERECFHHLVDCNTVGQYTGLNANGKKIFEGDVLQFSYTGENLGVEGQGTVVFKNGKFGVLWGWHKDLVCLDGFANTEVEVIENVFDNPELTR